ncbi:MAG: metallophosphoesterase [Candidatus Helarchaeota archaeon]
MQILAIGDPHLGDLEKMVSKFHYPRNYFEQVARNLAATTPSADLLLIAGDLVWNKPFDEIIEHLNMLRALKAKNICFIDGNHDWPWLLKLSKMYELYNDPQFFFVSGRTFLFEDVGICGACGTDAWSPRKVRELRLLENALTELARADIALGICLMHYPPSSDIFRNPEESVYGHIHKDHNLKINLYMKVDGIELYETAIDYFDWNPVQIF